MTITHPIKRIVFSSGFIAFILLMIFLMTTGYKYGWDDQHLEIPLLKSLIDPELYTGDYYVESLKKNFCSLFYPWLARIITTDQIPAVYFILYLISRYFLFYWTYKLWAWIAQDKLKAFLSVCVFLLMTRVDEFLYRTFSHQEFALAIIVAGIYYFFKKRFYLSAVLLGIATNFHALYGLFPMIYVGIYLLVSLKKHGLPTFIKTTWLYLLTALPVLIWIVGKRFDTSVPPPNTIGPDWLSLYIYACPQNFLLPNKPFLKIIADFNSFFLATDRYLPIIGLFAINIFFNETFKKNKKAITYCLSAFGLLLICFVFTYLYPFRFFLDLNLTRNTQFILFLLTGYTAIFIFQTIEKEKMLSALCLALLFTFMKYTGRINTAAIYSIFLLFVFYRSLQNPKKIYRLLGLIFSILLLILCLWGIWNFFDTINYRLFTLSCLFVICFFLISVYLISPSKIFKKHELLFRKLLYILPLMIFLFQYSTYNYTKKIYEKEDEGYWRLRRSWVDMQNYVKAHTPKDAILLVPHDLGMGDFVSDRSAKLSVLRGTAVLSGLIIMPRLNGEEE